MGSSLMSLNSIVRVCTSNFNTQSEVDDVRIFSQKLTFKINKNISVESLREKQKQGSWSSDPNNSTINRTERSQREMDEQKLHENRGMVDGI